MIVMVGRGLQGGLRLCCRYAALTVTCGVVFAVLGVLVTVEKLTFEASELHLLPPGQPYVARYREYSKKFGELDEIIIVVRGSTVDESKAYATRLVAQLRDGPIAFNHLAHRVTLADMDGRALLYAPTATLAELRDQVFDHQEFIQSFVAAPGLVALLEGANQQLGKAFASHFLDLGLQDGGTSGDLRFLLTLLRQLRGNIVRPALYRSPWGGLLSVGTDDPDAGYFLSEDKSLLFILADPVGGSGGFSSDRAAIEEIRRRIAGLRREFPAVQAGVTGGPALSNDEMRAAFDDSKLATMLAFALTLGLLFLAFRGCGQSLAMLTALVLSVAWSLGLITLTVGHLTVFSVMFMSIVMGLGIDYGIYLAFRYNEERALGRRMAEAFDISAARSGPGILMGALTAAATFYTLILTDFHGVQEFGFVAGTALLTVFVAMLTVFPALLVLMARVRTRARPADDPRRPAGIRAAGVPFIESLTRRPTAVLTGAGILTGFSLWSAGAVGFDYNLLHLQARGTESVIWERRIIETQTRSSFSALASARSLAELRRKQEAFVGLSTVAGVDSAILFIPPEQPAKQEILQHLAPLVTRLHVGVVPPIDLGRLRAALDALKRRIELIVTEAGAEAPSDDLGAIRDTIADLRRALRHADPLSAEPALNLYQARLVNDFGEKLRFLQHHVGARAVTLADVPTELRRKFVSDDGTFLLQIHPKVNVWDRDSGERFVAELRSVDPEVTGAPIVAYESVRLMEQAYRQGTLYAFALVFLISACVMRRLRAALLALTPLVLGTLWAVGLFYAFHLKLNLANVWGVPLIIGASAEYGLNVVVRVMEAQSHGGPLLARSTIMAVLLNGLTTISGFGSLLVAHHRGIWSLGLLLTIGSGTSLVASLVVLPVLIRLLEKTRHRSEPALATRTLPQSGDR